MLNKIKITSFLKVFISVFILVGCGSNEQEENIELHPIEDRIPYADHPVQKHLIEKNITGNSSGMVEIIISGEYLLSQPTFTQKLDISQSRLMELPFMSDQLMLFESVDENRIIIFDVMRQVLFEYQIDSDSWLELAGSGPGPGELSFANDIVFENDTLYVASQDSRITLFSCNDFPCEYSHVVNLDSNVQPVSIIANTDRFIVMGNKVTSRSENTSDININSMFEFDRSGSLIHSWGEIYDTKGHWMLLEPFSRGKTLARENSSGLVHFFEYFPFIYHYDEERQLDRIIQVDDFDMVQQEYWPKLSRLRVPEGNFSRIENLVFIDEDYYILSILHRREFPVRGGEDNFRVEFIKDFYLNNFTSEDTFYLGSLNNISEENNIHFTNHHIITKKSDEYHISGFALN
ncbi:hypothetical protein DYD21_08405 [Rhodohalobacter sp. SW132]|uniref:hypothetical protein n=1 Tax=Rhodohalobacter sp. SW132 TaxID=2293433 RepID=UPI000E264757|nr:hypothetical protein [Rhodohalobacter sp. SW132]REL37792.1 hypothetical protein DYD21_08405 [Rhodohalobacter sp. SW132]